MFGHHVAMLHPFDGSFSRWLEDSSEINFDVASQEMNEFVQHL